MRTATKELVNKDLLIWHIFASFTYNHILWKSLRDLAATLPFSRKRVGSMPFNLQMKTVALSASIFISVILVYFTCKLTKCPY